MIQHKFHLIAAPVVLAAIAAAYLISSKMEQKNAANPQASASAETLSISRATWGENCNALIETFNTDTATSTPLVEINNILERVSSICNGTPSCKFPANPRALGESPVPANYGCKKELVIEFRCNKLDLPSRIVAADEDKVEIDCAKKPKPITQAPSATDGTEQPQ
jgi:hypothetical protein